VTIGSFCLIFNEKAWIKAHLKAWTKHLDEMVFFDGGSTDGTLEILEADKSGKVRVYDKMTPKNLQQDYTDMSNAALRCLGTDIALFLHPDMFPENPEALLDFPDDMIAGSFKIKSYAGEPGEDIYEIVEGRVKRWKDIYRLKNPDLGAHYHGFYGATDEDIYFSEITGTEHEFFGEDFEKYPYPVFNSDLVIRHYSDVRPYARRLERMERCLANQGTKPDIIKHVAPKHPRVSLQNGGGFTFEKVDTPSFLEKESK